MQKKRSIPSGTYQHDVLKQQIISLRVVDHDFRFAGIEHEHC